jgi:hypothetical protein
MQPATLVGEGFGLAHWARNVRGRVRLDEALLAHLRAHPNFGPACIQVMRDTLDLNRANPSLARVVLDIRRSMLAFFVMYLHARGEVTVGTIHALCRELGLASPGRATALLINLRMIGYLIPDPVQKDRRSRRYIPAAAPRSVLAQSFRNRGLAFAMIEPEAIRVANRFDDQRVFDAYVSELANGLSAVLKRGDTSAFSLFAERNAGMGILYLLASSGEADDVFPPRRPIPISINALAADFKVSRAHVRKMLRDAEALGYVTRSESSVTLEEPLREAIVEYHAANYFAYASCACAALEAVGETP